MKSDRPQLPIRSSQDRPPVDVLAIARMAAAHKARAWGRGLHWQDFLGAAWRGASRAAANGCPESGCFWAALKGVVDQLRVETHHRCKVKRRFLQQPDSPVDAGELPVETHPENFPARPEADSFGREFQALLDSLPLRQAERDLLFERFVLGTEWAELAEREGMSQSEMFRRYRMILKRLRECLRTSDPYF